MGVLWVLTEKEQHVRCHFESVKTPEGDRAGGGPSWVMQMKIWTDLCKGIL